LHLKERGPAPTVDSRITPVVIVDDLTRFDGIQQDPPVGYLPFWGRLGQGPAAAQFSKIRLVNPDLGPTASIVVVLEGVWISTVGSVTLSILPQAGGSVAGVLRDSRVPNPIQSSKALLDLLTAAGADANPGIDVLAPNGGVFVDLSGVALAKGTMLSVQQTAVNLALTASFIWREYAAVVK
jgi:hypothetical protein